jgi:hypothetical protein
MIAGIQGALVVAQVLGDKKNFADVPNHPRQLPNPQTS